MEGSLTGRATPSLGSGCVLALGVGIVTFLPSWGGVSVSLEYSHLRGKKKSGQSKFSGM